MFSENPQTRPICPRHSQSTRTHVHRLTELDIRATKHDKVQFYPIAVGLWRTPHVVRAVYGIFMQGIRP